MKSRLEISFDEVADRERKHPSEESSRHLGALGKEASEIRGARVDSRLGIPGATHCLGLAGFRS